MQTRDGIGPRGKKFYCPRRTFRDDQQCVAINCKCSPKHANALDERLVLPLKKFFDNFGSQHFFSLNNGKRLLWDF